MHAPDMVFANHTAGESAERRGGARAHRQDLRVLARHEVRDPPALRPRGRGRPGVDGDRDPHATTLRRGELEAPPSGNTVSWDGIDVIPFEDGLDQAQGRLLGLGLDPAPGRPARLSAPSREAGAARLRTNAGQARGRRSGRRGRAGSGRSRRSVRVASPSSPITKRSIASEEIGWPPAVPLRVNSIRTPVVGRAPAPHLSGQVGDQPE